MGTRRQGAVVIRDYRPMPDACLRALQILLDQSVTKMAAEPTPEPDSHAAKESQDVCNAERIIP